MVVLHVSDTFVISKPAMSEKDIDLEVEDIVLDDVESNQSTFPASGVDDGSDVGEVLLLDGMQRKRRLLDVECDCAWPCRLGRCIKDKFDAKAEHCDVSKPTCCVFVVCGCFLTAIIITAIVISVDAAENPNNPGDEPTVDIDSDADADEGIPDIVTMLHLEISDMIHRYPDNLAIAFVLRQKESGDLVSIDCNHVHQRVERYSAETGALLIGSYDGTFVGNDRVCSHHQVYIGLTYNTVIAADSENAFVYFDASEWDVIEEPTIRFVDQFAWAPLHDCDAIQEDVVFIASEPIADLRLRDEAYARELLQPMWTVSQASATGGDVQQYNWDQFWVFYKRLYYDPNADAFKVDPRDTGHPLVPSGTSELTPHCSKSALMYDGLVELCTSLYKCSTNQVHSVPGRSGWDCLCLLQTFSFATSRVLCLSQDAECFARVYAWARMWDIIPCHTIGTCRTPKASLPIKVRTNGMVENVEEQIEFGCIERYDGGLQTYRNQL